MSAETPAAQDAREQQALKYCAVCTVRAQCEDWIVEAERDDPHMAFCVAAGMTPSTRRPRLARPLQLIELVPDVVRARTRPLPPPPDPRDRLLQAHRELEVRVAQLGLFDDQLADEFEQLARRA